MEADRRGEHVMEELDVKCPSRRWGVVGVHTVEWASPSFRELFEERKDASRLMLRKESIR